MTWKFGGLAGNLIAKWNTARTLSVGGRYQRFVFLLAALAERLNWQN